MFGKKKSKPEESQSQPSPEPPPPAVKKVPEPPPVSSWTPPDLPAGGGSGTVQVTPDYAGAPVYAANHIIVQGGEGKIVLDVATEMRDAGSGGKVLPVAARVVMTAQTGERLVKALEQAISKLKG